MNSLEALLKSREERAALQKRFAREYGTPLVSLTVNYPGPVKKTAAARVIFDAAVFSVRSNLNVTAEELGEPDTGFWALWAASMEVKKLKELCVGIEESHPLGRLFDIDVLDASAAVFSRRGLGLPDRPCLICGGNTIQCRREGRHELSELISEIERMTARWTM